MQTFLIFLYSFCTFIRDPNDTISMSKVQKTVQSFEHSVTNMRSLHIPPISFPYKPLALSIGRKGF